MTKDNYRYYISIMTFLYELLGEDTEIVLYDPDTLKVVHVVNPFDEDMYVGSDIRSLEENFIKNSIFEYKDYVVNYRAITKKKYKLKSSTVFFKNDSGKLEGILTVNQNVEKLITVRNIINELISGSLPDDKKNEMEYYEKFDISISGLVTKSIEEEIEKFGVDPERLTYEEKVELVKSLDEKGIFHVKGSINELAIMLKTTETSIYRYLQRLSE